MSLTKVVITPEVFLAMCTHALTTEAEEIMGLLLGDIRAEEGSTMVAYIRRAIPQIRTDRRKDRVETSPEQMAACTALAEHITTSTGLFTRVVGWYHSHPHITVLPSHVDVSTQAMYQRFDQGFVGLICSVFNANTATKEHTVQLTAFQAVQGAPEQQLLLGVSSSELGGLDDDMKAALAASAADMQQSAQDSWHRREVPLVVEADSGNPSTMADYVEVQQMLLAEEVQAHQQLSGSNPGNASSSSSSSLHQALLKLLDAAAHQQALLQHAECVLAPALQVMRQMAAQQQLQTQQLQADNERLKALLATHTVLEGSSAAADEGPDLGRLISFETSSS